MTVVTPSVGRVLALTAVFTPLRTACQLKTVREPSKRNKRSLFLTFYNVILTHALKLLRRFYNIITRLPDRACEYFGMVYRQFRVFIMRIIKTVKLVTVS